MFQQKAVLKFLWQGSSESPEEMCEPFTFRWSGAEPCAPSLPRCSWRRWKERPNSTWRPRPVPNDARCPMMPNVEVFTTNITILYNIIQYYTLLYNICNNACPMSPISTFSAVRISVPSHLDCPWSFGQALKDGAFTPWVRPGRPTPLLCDKRIRSTRDFVCCVRLLDLHGMSTEASLKHLKPAKAAMIFHGSASI